MINPFKKSVSKYSSTVILIIICFIGVIMGLVAYITGNIKFSEITMVIGLIAGAFLFIDIFIFKANTP